MSISSIFNGINNSNFAKNIEVSIDKDYNLCMSNLEGNCYDYINPRLNDVYDDKDLKLLVDEIKDLNTDEITPIEALRILNDIKTKFNS